MRKKLIGCTLLAGALCGLVTRVVLYAEPDLRQSDDRDSVCPSLKAFDDNFVHLCFPPDWTAKRERGEGPILYCDAFQAPSGAGGLLYCLFDWSNSSDKPNFEPGLSKHENSWAGVDPVLRVADWVAS
jgi:hypothetical protein